jgi:hypothetical protein
MLKPSSISINPRIRFEWKGKIHHVMNASELLAATNPQSLSEKEEILKKLHGIVPSLVVGGTGTVGAVNWGRIRAFFKIVRSKMKDKDPYVHEELADSRARICETCSMNVKITGCMGCRGIGHLMIHPPKRLHRTLRSCAV